MDDDTRQFRSVDELMRTTRVTTEDGRSLTTRPYSHGAVRVAEEGAYLIDILTEWETPGPYQSRLSPGLYQVVTLRDVEIKVSHSGQIATCIFREDVAASRWERPPIRYVTDTRLMALIVPSAFERWASLIKQEQVRRRQKARDKLKGKDFRIWNETCYLGSDFGPPDPFWNENGFRFNDPEGGEGVFLQTESGTYLHWGLNASGSRVSMMCGWIRMGGPPIP